MYGFEYDQFVECSSCDCKTTSSRVREGECPYCGSKDLTFGFAYISPKNELVVSLKQLPIADIQRKSISEATSVRIRATISQP